jgi:putative hydrolase of the HAD superfamily
VLDEIERESKGYGSASFARCLEATFRRLAEREVTADELVRVHGFAEQIRRHPMEIIAGVEETLAYLAPRHQLALLTKGEADEQRLKIEASGLAERFFGRTIVVPEKDVATYRRLVEELALAPDRAWMIGNSPRSDINPALAAGLNAVYVPHPQTWRLEHEEIARDGNGNGGGGRLLEVAAFAELHAWF